MPTEQQQQQQQPNQPQVDKVESAAQDVGVQDSKKLKCPLWFVP